MTTPGRYSDVEYVFEPHSSTIPDLREYAAALWERRTFMVELAASDLRNLRARTVLGNLWSVIDPLFQAGIYFFLYTVLRRGSNNVDFLARLVILPSFANVSAFETTMPAPWIPE